MSYLIVYKSVTFVNRVKRMVSNKYDVSVVQLPGDLGIKGCHYALKCRKEDFENIKRISEKNKIEIRAVFYEEQEDGKTRYVRYDIS